MEEQKQKWKWAIDLFIILAMMTIVVLLCHPIARNWSDDEIERYIGEEGAYSPDVDSFYYLRKAKEYSEGGVSSIKLISYRSEDAMCTPGATIAREAPGALPQLLPASAALVWYALRAFGINVGIYSLTIRFCSFLLALFVVPVYLFIKKRVSRTAAVLASLLVALEAPFFRHSHVGYFDTDAMIGLLALVFILSLYECILDNNHKKQIAYGVISVVAFFLLRFTWTAFFIYGIIAIGTTLVGVVVVRIIGKCKQEKEQKKCFLIPTAVVVSIILISILFGWDSFVSLAKGFLSPSVGAKSSWPSETMNISELKKVSLSEANSLWYYFLSVGEDVTSVTGGAFALILLLVSVGICFVYLVLSVKSCPKKNKRIFLLSAVLTWLFGTVVLALFGLRYMEFVALSSSIVIGLGYGGIEKYLEKKTLEGRRVFYIIVGLMVFGGLVLFLPIVAIVGGTAIMIGGWFLAKLRKGSLPAKALAFSVLLPVAISCGLICANETPYIERSMDDAMGWVRDNTPSDAVLADFWNLGYIYQYYGERRAIADGGTYNGQFFYWLANMVVTDDYRLSAGIARMLQNCGIDGSEYAQRLTGDAEEARNMLKTILPLPREEAESKLKEMYGLSVEQAASLLDYTHPLMCPDIYLVASHNTFDIASSLVAYRDWDGERNQSSGGVFYSTTSKACPEGDEEVYLSCNLARGEGISGVVIAVVSCEDELNGHVVSRNGKELECGRVMYIKEGEVVYDRRIDEPAEGRELLLDEALMIFESQGQVSAVLLEKGVLDSVVIRLFLLNGSGQDVFEKVYDSSDEQQYSAIQERLDDSSAVSIWKIKAE